MRGPRQDGRCGACGRGLPSPRGSWCSNVCELAWRINHIWSAARAEAIRRAGGRCEVCGSADGIQVHHDPPVRGRGGYARGCAHHQRALHVVCEGHHRELERLLRHPNETRQLALIAA